MQKNDRPGDGDPGDDEARRKAARAKDGTDDRSGAAPPEPGGAPRESDRDAGEHRPEEVELPAVELISALARLDLEAALAYEAAAGIAGDEELKEQLRLFARDHRVHLEALNEALEAEGEDGHGPDAAPAGPVLAGLLGLTGPLGDDVVVVTLLGNEQLTNLAYDAALSYDWDEETGAMLRRFQQNEERHVAWLADKHERLGGTTGEKPSPPPA